MKTCLIALLPVFCHGLAYGELKWDSQRVSVTAKPGDSAVEATYGFVNEGTEPVTFEKIESTCACITPTLPKMTYAPGERGSLMARFETTGRRGVQAKPVIVRIKGAKEAITLALVVKIPELLTLSPALAVWEKGDAEKTKTILCDAMHETPVRIVKVASSDARIAVRLETISEGKQYAIIVTPESTTTASFATLTIDTEFKDQKKSLRTYAQVKPTGVAPASANATPGAVDLNLPPSALKWDRQRADLTPGLSDTFVDAKFGFLNASPDPVTIEKVESSCGCTTATLPKMTFVPGERGELCARFDTTGRRGLQTKTVSVRIHGQADPAVLTLVVTIPELVRMSHQLLVWEKGEARESKTILCDATSDMPVRIVKVASSVTSIKASLKTVSEGRQYAITVTPENTDAASFAVLTIDAEFKDQKKSLRVYAQVKRSP